MGFKIFVQGGPFDGTEKGPLDGTEMGCLDGTAVRFSAIFFRKRVVSMVQLDFQKIFLCIYGFLGVPAVGEFQPWARASWGKGQFGEGPVCGSVTWRKCQFEDFNLSDSLSTVFILIHFYLMNATNENYFLNKIYSINNKL